MIWIDTNLYYSVAAGDDAYGHYGERGWMFDQESLRKATLMVDMAEWAICNAIRAITGALAYLIWTVLPDPNRIFSSPAMDRKALRPNSSSSTIRGVLPL